MLHPRFIILFMLWAILPFYSFSQTKPGKPGYQIKAKVAGIKDTVCHIAYHFGDKKFLKDTARVDESGRMVFEGKDPLPGGIYLLVIPNKTYFEFIVDKQQFFSIETDTIDFTSHMKITGSSDNQLFYDYLRFITRHGKIADSLSKEIRRLTSLDSTKTGQYDETIKKLRTAGREEEKQINEYKDRYAKEHPETFLAKLFLAMPEPVVSDSLIEANKSDSTFAFRYFKKHFFDNIDFSDDRLLRTPVFHGKIEKYFQKMTLQIPDSINKEADYVAGKAKANKEVFKFVVHYVTNSYERSNIMGMDAVFVHMAETYYMTGQAYWVDTANLRKISERARKLKPTLVGKPAPNIILPDTTGQKWYNLHRDIKSPYTVLVFWDSDCGHCKKEMPKLKELYDKYKGRGVEVFAVGTETDSKSWLKYIREHNLNWINVKDNEEIRTEAPKNPYKYLGHPYYTTIESLNYRSTYDIYSTPRVFLLNDRKEIIAKQIGADQLGEILEKKLDGGKSK